MPTPKQFVDLLLSQDGDEYVFGHEVNPANNDPSAFDCSELIEWGCNRLGVVPKMPDGSWYQVRHCAQHSMLMNEELARSVPGALLFRFVGDPFVGGRPRSAHVAVSQGNGRTIEARSRVHGVGQFSVYGRGWTHAGLIPGLHEQVEEDPVISDEDVERIAKAVWRQMLGPSSGPVSVATALQRAYLFSRDTNDILKEEVD